MPDPSPPSHPERQFFSSPVITIGEFRCGPSHPLFTESGPTSGYCFVFPRTAFWIQHEGSAPFVADANSVPLYNPGRPFRRARIASDGVRTDWFSVAPGVLREMLQNVDAEAADAATRLFRFDFGRVASRAFRRQREVVTHVQSTACPDVVFVEESALAVLEGMLSELYGARPARQLTSRHRDLAEDARAWLAVTYAAPTSLTELARAVGASPFHLCRVFRQHTGTTLHRYRNELRLRRSLELLDEAGEDLLAMAIALGYSGHSHFTAAFHRAFGVTPSGFRDASRRSRAAVRERAAAMLRNARSEPGADQHDPRAMRPA
jgi:AraC-like DNA-binding protein